jgi:hypothetical protein
VIACCLDGLNPVGGLGDDVDVGLGIEDQAEVVVAGVATQFFDGAARPVGVAADRDMIPVQEPAVKRCCSTASVPKRSRYPS